MTERTFSGAAYDPELDQRRLALQIERIRRLCADGAWRTLREMKTELEILYAPTYFPEASISANLRNLRKPGFCYRVEKRRRAGARGPGSGLFEYQLLPPLALEDPQREMFGGEKKEAGERMPVANRASATSEHDAKGREEFFRAARRIAGLQ